MNRNCKTTVFFDTMNRKMAFNWYCLREFSVFSILTHNKMGTMKHPCIILYTFDHQC